MRLWYWLCLRPLLLACSVTWINYPFRINLLIFIYLFTWLCQVLVAACFRPPEAVFINKAAITENRLGNGDPLQYYCLGNPMDRGAWQATAHGVAKNRTQQPNTTTLPKPLISSLAWKILWTEEPGRLQAMGSQKVGHDWSDLEAAAAGWNLNASQLCGL